MITEILLIAIAYCAWQVLGTMRNNERMLQNLLSGLIEISTRKNSYVSNKATKPGDKHGVRTIDSRDLVGGYGVPDIETVESRISVDTEEK